MRLFIFLLLVFGCCLSTYAQVYQHSIHVRTSAPKQVRIDGRSMIYYELYLTSFSPDSIYLKDLVIYEAAGRKSLFVITNEELNLHISSPSSVQPFNGILRPGFTAIVYIEFPVSDLTNSGLIHKIGFTRLWNSDSTKEYIETGITPVIFEPPLVIGPPVGRGTWTAVYHSSWPLGHRRVIYTLSGQARIPGRFAIDFFKIDSNGRYATQNNHHIVNWYGYGAPVLAVADGIVETVGDQFGESPTISGHPRYSADKATGNYIAIKIGENQIAFYEHLKPGSIIVKPGQKVNKGQVLAAVGFTGQSMGPHLHFHIADHNSPLGAEGIPFVFESFSLLGSFPDFSKFGKEKWVNDKRGRRVMVLKERPPANAVIEF